MGNQYSPLMKSGAIQWDGRPVFFHSNTGRNIILEGGGTVASRARSFDYGTVVTSEPVCIGQMLKITVLRREEKWRGGLVSVTTQASLLPQNGL